MHQAEQKHFNHSVISDSITVQLLATGLPALTHQTAFAPLLTRACITTHQSNHVIKSADDTTAEQLFANEDESAR